MKHLFILLYILFFHIAAPAYAECTRTICISHTASPNAPAIQKMFEDVMPKGTVIIYTKVPRGLIVSVDEDTLFSDEDIAIKAKGTGILDAIVKVLKELDNECTVESHTENHNYDDSLYKSDWELSTARAGNIVDYLVYCGGISSNRLFALGYGEVMPFKGNVSTQEGFNKRIDFVIFDYEISR